MAKLVTAKELSKVLNYSEEELLDFAYSGKLPHLTFQDKGILFPLEEVFEILKPRLESPKEEKKATKKVARKYRK